MHGPFFKFLKNLVHDNKGATAIEYALIAVFISIAIAATIFNIGTGVLLDYYKEVLTGLHQAR